MRGGRAGERHEEIGSGHGRRLETLDMGAGRPYGWALELQERLVAERKRGERGDTLVMVEHEPVYTLGRGARDEHILLPPAALRERGIEVVRVGRGGDATYHGPGQLVVYPIIRLGGAGRRVVAYVGGLEETLIRSLADFGIVGERDARHRGVWVGTEKVAAVGIRVTGGVTMHGFALNVSPDLDGYRGIVPCGISDRGVTSLRRLGLSARMEDVKRSVERRFREVFGYESAGGTGMDARGEGRAAGRAGRKPAWLRARLGSGPEFVRVRELVRKAGLHTVCEEALCPNRGQCWEHGRATFMILGDVCTRGCRFCNVRAAPPAPPDVDEPRRVAEAVAALGLRNVVLTSVTRDDLGDGGAGFWVETIHRVRRAAPSAMVEALIPDFGGNETSLDSVLAAKPDVLGHNVETVPSLYATARPGASFRRSLAVLRRARDAGCVSKTALMAGLGETEDEILATMRDAREAGCEIFYMGQYLQPTKQHLPVRRYWEPAAFETFRRQGLEMGFAVVVAGPLVRSSYHAEEQEIYVRGRMAPPGG